MGEFGKDIPPSDEDLTIADIIGEKYPSPDQLAAVHGVDELRSSLHELTHQDTALQEEIAILESRRKRVRAEKLITEQALRLLADRGLE